MSRRNDRRILEQGEGWYRYKNISGSDILLQRPLTNGRSMVMNNSTFEGDSTYASVPGIQCVENLCHMIKKLPEPIPEHVEQTQALIVEAPSAALQFFESTGEPVAEDKTDITFKELSEYAQLRGVEYDTKKRMSKAALLEIIRSQKK